MRVRPTCPVRWGFLVSTARSYSSKTKNDGFQNVLVLKVTFISVRIAMRRMKLRLTLAEKTEKL